MDEYGSMETKRDGSAAMGTETPVTEQVKQQAQQVVQQGKEATGRLVDQARDQVKSQASAQKDRAATGLSDVAEVFRQTGHQLQGKGQDTVGEYAHKAADQITQITDYLNNRNIDQLVGEAEDFARRQPLVFLGTAFVLGITAARFLKSSGKAVGNSGTGGELVPYQAPYQAPAMPSGPTFADAAPASSAQADFTSSAEAAAGLEPKGMGQQDMDPERTTVMDRGALGLRETDVI